VAAAEVACRGRPPKPEMDEVVVVVGGGGAGSCGKGSTRRGHAQLALLAVQRAIEVLHL
jgi:hypothetical protein